MAKSGICCLIHVLTQESGVTQCYNVKRKKASYQDPGLEVGLKVLLFYQ